MRNRGKVKNVYVVKSAPKDIDEKHQGLEGKNVYLLKEDAQAINKYKDTVLQFVDGKDGLFLVLSHDKTFFQNFRNSFYKELQIAQERIRLTANPKRAMEEIHVYREYRKQPFLFVESTYESQSTLPFIEELKGNYQDIYVILLMNDAEEKKLAQFLEAGVDNFITKPVSVNMLVEKIANTLVPQDAIGKMVREGKRRIKNVEFALAYGVARDILEQKPGSPAGLMVMGDALKGLSKRAEALKLYQQAVDNAPQYLEPRKKLVEFYKEEGAPEEALKQLMEIDELSPLNLGRKREIADLHFMHGDYGAAADYYLQAVTLAHGFRDRECVQMAEDYAHKIFNAEQDKATGLFRLCSKMADAYKVELDEAFYNRLGMLLRRDKRWAEAVEAYEQAVKRSPDDSALLFNMGMAYVEGKDYGSAAQKFERVLRRDAESCRENLKMAYLMGQVFIKASRPSLAAKVLSMVYRADPDYKQVKSLLQSLDKSKKKKL